jgi:SWI/SNF-related matrix-associated actin-dependent regulator 1 of chromatin subfamily A
MIRRRKKDVLKELPEKTRIIIPIQLSKAQQEIYDEAQNDFLNWLKKADANKALKAAKALELVKIGYLKRLAVQLKMEYVNKWIVDYYETNEEQKLVLFGIHKQFLRGLQNDFADKKPIVLTGDTPKHKKKLAEKLFQQDPKRKLFIGNIQAAGTGLTLTKSKTGGMLELDWNPGAMIQAEDRLHRITQHDPVMIYYFIAKNTIEEPLCKLLHNKQKVLDQILDGQDVPDFNLYTELKNYLKAKAKG